MSNHLRNDKECLNCGYIVDKAYCSSCGQKNTETRQSFGHLFTHFIEDLTHYDGAFWKTMKFLLFHPARLTKEYLEGHRMRYVPPVKLYIFISFITFFLLSVMPDTSLDAGDAGEKETMEKINEARIKGKGEIRDIYIGGHRFKSIPELRAFMESERADEMSTVQQYLAKVTLKMDEENLDLTDVVEGFMHILPKVLFIYMPIFAFGLWIVHGKKRWYFFDHGIFTLHYFSFLLLLFTIIHITNFLFDLTGNYTVTTYGGYITLTFFFLYSVFYFFRSHRRMYGEKRWVSRLKSLFLFVVNYMLISTAIVLTVIYVLLTIH